MERLERRVPQITDAPRPKGRVTKLVGDLAIVVADVYGEEDDNRLPAVGDTVQFSGGAIGHVIGLSDLCFAAALPRPEDPVAVGDNYAILPKSLQPLIAVPETGGVLVDLQGEGVSDEERTAVAAGARVSTAWFGEMVGLIKRQRIDAPLHAGVMGLDAFVPIGRGQSMLLRLPPGLTPDQLRQFQAHIVEAQAGNSVEIVAAAATVSDGRQLQGLVAGADAAGRLTIVAGQSEAARLGEAVLAMNAACAAAEAHRDQGKDSLLLLDLEPLHRMWSVLAEVSETEGLAEVQNRAQNKEIDTLTDELGVELWRYVARKNANTARRRTFLGCFLQRAGRMAEERGGGSMTLLAFARLKDSTKMSRLEMEVKLRNLKQMQLDEAVRKRAVEKLEAQMAALSAENDSFGIPDDFIEEAKAVTDGHVVFSDATLRESDQPRWCVDLRESVARGITAHSVQNRALDKLRSLNLKMYLMHREADDRSEVMDVGGRDQRLDNAPLLALMQQPVGDVLSPEDEAALLLLATDDAERVANARPLAQEVLGVLSRARVRLDGGADALRALSSEALKWAVDVRREADGGTLKELGPPAVDSLADFLGLRPLERKRLLAAAAEETAAHSGLSPAEAPAVVEDPRELYASLRERLGFLRTPMGAADLMAAVAEPGTSDEELSARLAALHARIAGRAA